MRTWCRLAAGALAATLLAGCGAGAPDQVTAPTATSGGSAVTSSPTPGAPPPSRQTPAPDPLGDITPPSRSPSTTTLRGVIVEGVEAGCLLLATDRGEFLLLGGPRDALAVGTRVEVTGSPDPALMTTCQQGTPFIVRSVRAITR